MGSPFLANLRKEQQGRNGETRDPASMWRKRGSDEHSDGCLLWWSDNVFRSYFPLKCLTTIGILFILDKNLFIRDEAENFPFFTSSIACCTGLLSGSIMMGCRDSRRRGYSDSIATATDIASTSHGDLFLH